jgi:single-strand DNA-binding protein
MAGLCKLSAIGRLGRDSELKFTPAGKPLLKWSMAVDVGWGESKQTQWLRCTMWGERGEKIQQYLLKGTQVYIDGNLTTREWDAQDGQKRFDVEVSVGEVVLLGGKRDDGERPQLGEGQTADEVPW